MGYACVGICFKCVHRVCCLLKLFFDFSLPPKKEAKGNKNHVKITVFVFLIHPYIVLRIKQNHIYCN